MRKAICQPIDKDIDVFTAQRDTMQSGCHGRNTLGIMTVDKQAKQPNTCHNKS